MRILIGQIVNYFIGKCYEGLGNDNKAREYWTKSLNQTLQRVTIAFYYRGLAARCLGQTEEAEKLFRLVKETAEINIERKRDLPVNYILYALSLESTGQSEQSKIYRKMAFEIDKLAEFRAFGKTQGRIQMVSPSPRF